MESILRYREFVKQEKEAKQAFRKKFDLIKEDIEQSKHQKADYVMYTNDCSMSVADPSYIYDKYVGGVRKPRLLKKLPKNTEELLEIGYLKNGQCLYEKIYHNRHLWATYVYKKNKIYRVDSEYVLYSHIYEFDENNVVKSIERGYEEAETYQWLNENIAFVDVRMNLTKSKLLLIKDNDEVLAVFSIEDDYDTSGTFKKEAKSIIVSDLVVQYSGLMRDGKHTYYYKINCLGDNYIGRVIYMKPPKNFSYKKAKESFKDIVLDTIKSQIKETQFPIETIGILYKNEGYDIDDITIGFDDKDSVDVTFMKKTFDIEFNEEAENMNFLNEYIQSHRYYSAFRKVIYRIKDELEKEYKVRVTLTEIND